MSPPRLSSHLAVFFLLGALEALPACESPQASGDLMVSPEVAEAAGHFRIEYLITIGDTLDVVVLNHAEVGRSVVVRPDGFISLPMLDDVAAEGLTIPELDRSITERLSTRLKDPEVTVIATSVRQPQVFVYGEVIAPRVIPLREASTVAQALATAGGFDDTADTENVVLLRIHDDGRLVATKIELTLDGQPAPWMAAHAIRLRPDDMIFVPKTGIAQVDDWINSYVTKPLTGVNQLLNSYASIKIAQALN